MSSNKKLFIKSYGCQMNAYDSDRMADVLAPHGYDVAAGPEDADIVILNTCHIREKAAEKVFSELGRLRPMQATKAAAGGRMMVAVAGCVAQAEGEEIARRAPYVDIVVGPQTYHRLPELVARAERLGGSTVVDTDFPVESKFDLLPQPRRSGVTAFLSIQEGCDRFCTFCVVPYTRGAEYSRPVEAVVAEAEALVGASVREITLLGQNVNAYHGAAPGGSTGEWSLARLIERLAEIEGLERIRYTTSHPHDMSDDLIAVHGAVDKLMPYLHLPVQAGSDRILTAMNRRYTADSYRRLVDRLRRARPDLALSSDFIVGFPGETDGDFAATLRVVTDIGFAQAFTFMYSPRPGTPAAAMEAQVPEPVRSERLAMLQELLGAQQQAFNARCVGETLPVLVEKRGRYRGQVVGRSPYLQPVHFASDESLVGTILPVTITERHANSLAGAVHPFREPPAAAKEYA